MRCQPAPWLQAEAPRLGVEKPPDGEATERIRSNQGVAVYSSAHTVQHGEARCRARLCRAAVRARMAGWRAPDVMHAALTGSPKWSP